MKKWEWAWLAGLFEGEGTMGFSGKSGVQVRIGMTDKDVIDSVHRLFPTSSVWRETKNRKKPLYVWQVCSRDDAKRFLEGVIPYLHVRRAARAVEALARLELNLGAKPLRTHCIRGHPFSGENLQRTSVGRQCRTCRRDYDRQRRRKS